jgi:hypothetical protein
MPTPLARRRRRLNHAWKAADFAWQTELNLTFGPRAYVARLSGEGEGQTGTALNSSFVAFDAARAELLVAMSRE